MEKIQKSEFIERLSRLTPQEINKLIEQKGKKKNSMPFVIEINNPNNNMDK